MTIVMIDGDAVLMTDADAALVEQLPGISPQSRAEIFGASSYWEQRADEARHPWLTDWSARYGVAPARWKAWTAAGRPAPDHRELCICGERPIVEAFRETLAKLPPAVAWWVIGHALIVCGGQANAGSCGAFPRLPPVPPSELHLVQLHVADEAIAGHEVGHVWSLDPCPLDHRMTAARRDELRDAAVVATVQRGDLDAWQEELWISERAADRLASRWLNRVVDTTSGSRGERRRRAMERDVDQALGRAVASGGDKR